MSADVAFVTGASRGIGKAVAIALAEAGFDVIVSARTVKPGEARDNTLTVHHTDTRVLPGSLEETAAAIEQAGQRAHTVPLDLTDRASVGAAAQLILDTVGGVDVLVHSGRYVGPGLMDVFQDTPVEAYERFFEAHCIGPILLTKALLPGMLDKGRGQVITVTSASAWRTPPAPAGQGGWGLGYAVGKASGHVLVPTLHAEFASRGLLAFNLEPGYIATERNEIVLRGYGRELTGAAPPAVVGAALVWLVTSTEGAGLSGTTVDAQELCRERGLFDW